MLLVSKPLDVAEQTKLISNLLRKVLVSVRGKEKQTWTIHQMNLLALSMVAHHNHHCVSDFDAVDNRLELSQDPFERLKVCL